MKRILKAQDRILLFREGEPASFYELAESKLRLLHTLDFPIFSATHLGHRIAYSLPTSVIKLFDLSQFPPTKIKIFRECINHKMLMVQKGLLVLDSKAVKFYPHVGEPITISIRGNAIVDAIQLRSIGQLPLYAIQTANNIQIVLDTVVVQRISLFQPINRLFRLQLRREGEACSEFICSLGNKTVRFYFTKNMSYCGMVKLRQHQTYIKPIFIKSFNDTQLIYLFNNLQKYYFKLFLYDFKKVPEELTVFQYLLSKEDQLQDILVLKLDQLGLLTLIQVYNSGQVVRELAPQSQSSYPLFEWRYNNLNLNYSFSRLAKDLIVQIAQKNIVPQVPARIQGSPQKIAIRKRNSPNQPAKVVQKGSKIEIKQENQFQTQLNDDSLSFNDFVQIYIERQTKKFLARIYQKINSLLFGISAEHLKSLINFKGGIQKMMQKYLTTINFGLKQSQMQETFTVINQIFQKLSRLSQEFCPNKIIIKKFKFDEVQKKVQDNAQLHKILQNIATDADTLYQRVDQQLESLLVKVQAGIRNMEKHQLNAAKQIMALKAS